MQRSLYTTFIRPLLEFAVPVWSPHLKGNSDMIERVTKLVTSYKTTKLVATITFFDYEERLADRRLRGFQMIPGFQMQSKCIRLFMKLI